MSEIQKLKDEIKKYKEEVERLQKSLEIASYWNDKNNVKELSLRATQRGVIIEKQEKEIQKLKDENKSLKSMIHKLKNENKKLKSNSVGSDKRIHNERGAGRKERFSDQEKEMMKMYRIQGKTIKEIAQMYSCSVGLIHKIINE